jgi:uncharacterized protein
MDTLRADPALVAFVSAEVALLLAGLAALYLFHFRDRAEPWRRDRLTPWDVSPSTFAIGVMVVCIAGIGLQFGAVHFQRRNPDLLTSEGWMVLTGGAFQVGMLAGAGLAFVLQRYELSRGSSWIPGVLPAEYAPLSRARAVPGGVVLFLACLPVVTLVSVGWQQVLSLTGAEIDRQEMIDLLLEADSPWIIVGVAILAVVVAPVTEEILFRGGLFRYLRTRIPRLPALLIPAVIFAALHANLVAFAPLVALGILLAVAYERTGRIAVPILAHALFNLHTLALLLSGFDF